MPAVLLPDDGRMASRTVHLRLELEVDGDSVTGHVISGNGEPARISGRLSLFGAIEQLIADEPPDLDRESCTETAGGAS